MASGFVDLRSDTVTRPTPEMRRAMADADVGDDVYGEGPTVNALQEALAERVVKQAALFVPSGTMGNQLALRLLTTPGTSVIAGRRQHVVIYENGAGGRNAGVQFWPVADDDGTINPADVRWAVEAAAHHHPRPSLVCVENTHMPANGAPWPLERLREVAVCGLPVHLDGARLFNAEVATGVAAADYAGAAVTVMCCLSKGLSAPVGSMLAGPADVMAAARGERQRLGGGMRQAGGLAAAGLVALKTMVGRLADDHPAAGFPVGAGDGFLAGEDTAKAVLGLVGEAGSLVHRVADHGVLVALLGADVPGDRRAGRDADGRVEPGLRGIEGQNLPPDR